MSVGSHISVLTPAKPVEVMIPAALLAGLPAPGAETPVPGPSADPAPFFFGGARRSGGAWLAGMLNAHPQIECRPEGGMFNGFGASFPDWLDEGRVRAWAERTEARDTWLRHQTIDQALRAMRRAMWMAITRQAVEREGRKSWPALRVVGEKTTPHFCLRCDEISRTFPDARFLHVLRDGRDVVVADMFLLFRTMEGRDLPADARAEVLASREHHLFGNGRPVALFGPAILRHLVSDWAAAASGGRRARELFAPTGKWHEVRCERIVERPADGLRGILEWLGVEADPALVKHLVNTSTVERLAGARVPGEEDRAADRRKGVSGDWRNHFTNDDKALFKSIAGELLVELGFEKGMGW